MKTGKSRKSRKSRSAPSVAWVNIYDNYSKKISKNQAPRLIHRPRNLSIHKTPLHNERTNVKKLYFSQKAHEESCQYGDAKCAACNETMERRHLKQHRENDCVNRAVACTYCGGEVRQRNMKV